MENETIYEVVLGRDVLDVKSANTEFYAFMGSRMYCHFDRLVQKEAGLDLAKYLSSNSHVLLDLLSEDKNTVRCLGVVTSNAKEDRLSLRMVALDDLLGRRRVLQEALSHQYAILGLYNDYYFEYTVSTDRMRVYTIDRHEKDYLSLSLDEFERRLYQITREDAMPDAEKLITALRSGGRQFEFLTPGNLLSEDEAALTLIKGRCCYENAEYTYAAGYIHLGNERYENAKKDLERDFLTGLLAKSEITNLAINTIDVKKINDITLAIIDIDYFKTVNDVYGHKEGDNVLKRVAAIIENEVGDTGVAGRIGGDEFMVLFYDAYDMENMRERLKSIKSQVAAAYAKNEAGEGLGLTLSMGCAAYPKDADNYEDLFTLADFALYRAKEKGRNRYVIYNAEKHGDLSSIKSGKTGTVTLTRRNNMSPTEIMCSMMDSFYTEANYPLQSFLNDIVTNFEFQRVSVYAGQPYRLAGMCGSKILPRNVLNATLDYMYDPFLQSRFDKKHTLVIDNCQLIESSQPELYDKLCMQSILSLIQIKFKDKNGLDALLSLESVDKRVTWNHSLLPCYRLLAKMLSEFDLA